MSLLKVWTVHLKKNITMILFHHVIQNLYKLRSCSCRMQIQKAVFLLDDTEVIEIIPSIHIDNLGITDEYLTDMHSKRFINNDKDDNRSSSLSSTSSLVQTISIPVVDNMSYTYSIEIDDKNIDSIKSYALFRESSQPETVQYTTTTATNNTDTDVITDTEAFNQAMDTINDNTMGYILEKNIDIIKSGNYSFDFQFYNNGAEDLNKPIKLVIDGVERDYQSLSGNDSTSCHLLI